MSFSFLFPGQGSQYSGMFKDHFEEFPEFNEVIGAPEKNFTKKILRNIIFSDDSRLSDTYYTQPILMLMSFALFKVWKKNNCPTPKVAAGHSLGEVSAFLCAGSLNSRRSSAIHKIQSYFYD